MDTDGAKEQAMLATHRRAKKKEPVVYLEFLPLVFNVAALYVVRSVNFDIYRSNILFFCLGCVNDHIVSVSCRLTTTFDFFFVQFFNF